MESFLYEDYVIVPQPHELRKSGHWTVNIRIERHVHGTLNAKPFYASNTFPTREGAVRRCVAFGKQIIDGQVQGCTVDDL